MASADRAAAAVRRANTRECLLALRTADGPATAADLASATELSRTTVVAILQELETAGSVRAVGPAAPASRGGTAGRFAFEPSAATAAAVDLGARSVRCLLADGAGDVRASLRAPAAAGEHLAVAESLLRRADAPLPGAIGVAVPGILSADGALAQSLAIPDLVGLDPAAALEERLGCPVVADNDIKLAALAEQRLGAGTADMVLVQLGHRVSVAIIVGGEILQGSHRLAGELGSQRGMRWTASSRRGRLRWSTGDEAEPLFARAADGDRAAIAEIDEFCAQIAPRLAALLLTVDPEVLVVGGGLSRSGELLLEPLRRHVNHLLMSPE